MTVVCQARVYGDVNVLPKQFAVDALQLNLTGYTRLAELVRTSIYTALSRRCIATITDLR